MHWVHEAVLKACDALDGVKDGVIENPTVCHFDLKALVCRGVGGTNCLTTAQAETSKALYSADRLQYFISIGWQVVDARRMREGLL